MGRRDSDEGGRDEDGPPGCIDSILDPRFVLCALIVVAGAMGIGTLEALGLDFIVALNSEAPPDHARHLAISSFDTVVCNATSCARHLYNDSTCLDQESIDHFMIFNNIATIAGILATGGLIAGFVLYRCCPRCPLPLAELVYMVLGLANPLVCGLVLASIASIASVRYGDVPETDECKQIAALHLTFATGFALNVVRVCALLIATVGGFAYLIWCSCFAEDEVDRELRRRRGGEEQVGGPTDTGRIKLALSWASLFGVCALVASMVAAEAAVPVLTGVDSRYYGMPSVGPEPPATAIMAIDIGLAKTKTCTRGGCETTTTKKLADKTSFFSRFVYARYANMAVFACQLMQLVTMLTYLLVIKLFAKRSKRRLFSVLVSVGAIAQVLVVIGVATASGFVASGQSATLPAELGDVDVDQLSFGLGSAVQVTVFACALFNAPFSIIAAVLVRRSQRAAGEDPGLLGSSEPPTRYM